MFELLTSPHNIHDTTQCWSHLEIGTARKDFVVRVVFVLLAQGVTHGYRTPNVGRTPPSPRLEALDDVGWRRKSPRRRPWLYVVRDVMFTGSLKSTLAKLAHGKRRGKAFAEKRVALTACLRSRRFDLFAGSRFMRDCSGTILGQ